MKRRQKKKTIIKKGKGNLSLGIPTSSKTFIVFFLVKSKKKYLSPDFLSNRTHFELWSHSSQYSNRKRGTGKDEKIYMEDLNTGFLDLFDRAFIFRREQRLPGVKIFLEFQEHKELGGT